MPLLFNLVHDLFGQVADKLDSLVDPQDIKDAILEQRDDRGHKPDRQHRAKGRKYHFPGGIVGIHAEGMPHGIPVPAGGAHVQHEHAPRGLGYGTNDRLDRLALEVQAEPSVTESLSSSNYVLSCVLKLHTPT